MVTLNLTAKNNNRLLIHKNMEPVTLEKSIDIILTPPFYTFLREDLEINFGYQAKQIAPSLFDGYVNPSVEHQYYVYKCDHQWCFVAYNIDEIDLFLKSVGIEKHRVSKIFFAQQIVDALTDPIRLSEKSALVNIDDVATVVPTRLLNKELVYQTIELDALKLKGGVTMGASLNSFVSLKETIILSLLLFILGSVFMVEANRIKSSIATEDAQLTALLDENPKYASSMLRNSILEKYRPIDTNERLKRESMKEISKLLSAKSQLKTLTINEKLIKADITTTTRSIHKQVKEHAIAKKFKTSGSGLDLKVEKRL